MILAKSIGIFLTLIFATNGSIKMRKILFVSIRQVYADYIFANLLKCVRFSLFEQVHEISNNVVCAASKASDQPVPAHTCSLIRAFVSRLSIL